MTDRPVVPGLSDLRRRTSVKWSTYPDDVLPMFIAEMDYSIAPVVADAMIAAIRADDVGYVGSAGGVGEAFAGFAARRWQWAPEPADVALTTDVSVAIVETLRAFIAPGDGVIINPPVYPPFFELIPEAGGRCVQVPLIDRSDAERSGPGLDLAGIERGLAEGARAVLLCHPHNPLGLVHPREDLEQLAAMAADFGALVISDEIHAPLVHRAVEYVPFLAVNDEAREVGIVTHSASKGFNIAGAKCALMIAASENTRGVLARQPEEVGYRTSILGRAAAEAAFAHGDEWLDAVILEIDDNLMLLEELVGQWLPGVTVRRPQASYLAWLDFTATGLGDDPAEMILERGKVALNSGLAFGEQGRGFARLNAACAPDVLTDAIERIARVVREG